jgi:molybdopterin-guanine dinucleotide biosynthesis protein A
MHQTSSDAVTGLVLAGGRGSRMGGVDKGLALYQGRPLVAAVIERLAGQVSDIMISCNRNQSHYRSHATTILTDYRADFQGPLAGIESAVAGLRTPLLAVVACDTPELPNDLVARLSRGLGENNAAAYAHDGVRDQYLFALIHSSALTTLRDYLDAGGRSVKGWYDLVNASAIDFSDQPEAFININQAQKNPAVR